MASFPGSKVHRVSRRRLGRGQSVQAAAVVVSVAPSANTMQLTFNTPCVVSGPIVATVATRTIVSQTIVSPTRVDILFSDTVASKAWTVNGPASPVRSYQGGQLASASGTFSA